MITAIVKDRYYRNDRIVAFARMIREWISCAVQPARRISAIR
jgi:hypothetical protein